MIEFWQKQNLLPDEHELKRLADLTSRFCDSVKKIEAYLSKKVYRTSIGDDPNNTTFESSQQDEESAIKLQRSSPSKEGAKPNFSDFSQPSTLKTGFLIPLSQGHNGQWTNNELTLLEVHLVNAGIIESVEQ